MISLGVVSFLNPWALTAAGLVPAVWLFLRFLPPAPRRIPFPPVRLLQGLGAGEQASGRTPPWLTAIRIALLLVLIGAAAQPVLNARGGLAGMGPLVVVVDNGWAAARAWAPRRPALDAWIGRAESAGRAVVLLPTAARAGTPPPVDVMSADAARRVAAGLVPMSWDTDRKAALARLQPLSENPAGAVVWLADGLAEPGGEAAQDAWVAGLRRFGPLTVVLDRNGPPVIALSPAQAAAGGLAVSARRPTQDGSVNATVLAEAADGAVLGRASLTFAPGAAAAQAVIDLPSELRERAETVRLEDAATAGSVVLLDDRWRRRAVGLVGGEGAAPLLGPAYYLTRALSPLAEVRQGGIADMMARPPAIVVLADPPALAAADVLKLEEWIAGGGVLVRFAGPRLAASPDPLVPVALRSGGRALGGALSWDKPVALGAFPETGPFKGLPVPADVTVSRQVLADPAPDLADRTWARLADGTPLVTASRRGDGWLVLVHTTADASWSNLTLSGVFVDMMERLVLLGRGGAGGGGMLSPLRLLDGFGGWGAGKGAAAGLDAAAIDATRPGPDHPPGLYGQGTYRRALNLGPSVGALSLLGPLPQGVARDDYGGGGETDARPALLTVALALVLADLAAALALRGLLVWPRRWRRVGAVALVTAVAFPGASYADGAIPPAALETRLAYVKTGDAALDRLTADGLRGLGVMVNRRTAALLGTPVGVDPAKDELTLYPLLYWPVSAGHELPEDEMAAKLATYLERGGVVLFDTGMAEDGGTDATALRRLADALRLPALVPAPADHVLGRSFYLLNAFPGRWAGGVLWVERADERVNDGVSAVIAGGQGWAAAWAMDDTQRFEMPVVPGGESQRELALRFGINLVMYVLSGNYKSDQVHVPAILERLRQ